MTITVVPNPTNVALAAREAAEALRFIGEELMIHYNYSKR